MKTFLAAIGAIALATTVAEAAPAQPIPAQAGVTAQSYQVVKWRHYNSAKKRTPNQGSGTSRSKDANQG